MGDNSQKRLDLRITTPQILMVIGIAAAVYALSVLLLVFAGILLAVLLHGLSNWITRHTFLSYGWSLTLVVFDLAILFLVSLSLVAPDVVDQVYHLSQQLPQAVQRLEAYFAQYEGGQEILAQIGESLMPSREFMLAQAGNIFSSTLNALTIFIIILFVGLYGAAQPRLYVDEIVQLVPLHKRQRVRTVLQEVGRTLRWWLLGRIISMTMVGMLTMPGLWLLDIPHILTLGLLAGLLAFIPYIGPILSVVPAAFLALLQGPIQVVNVLLLYFFIQLIESYLLTPLVQERMVAMPPVFTISVQVLFGALLGFSGLMLATPITVAMRVFVRMLYVEDRLDNSSKKNSLENNP